MFHTFLANQKNTIEKSIVFQRSYHISLVQLAAMSKAL